MLVWTSDCRQGAERSQASLRKSSQSTGCSKSHRVTEGCTSDNMALFKQQDPGVQGQSCGHCGPHLSLCWGPRGAGSLSPHHPRTPTPGGPSASQGSWEQLPALGHACVAPPPIHPGPQLPSFHPQPGCQEQRRPSGPRALSPALAPLLPLPSSGSPQPPAQPPTPSPGLGRPGGDIRAQPPRPDSLEFPGGPGTSLLCQDEVRGWGLDRSVSFKLWSPLSSPSGPTAPSSLLGPPPPAPRAGGSQQKVLKARFHACALGSPRTFLLTRTRLPSHPSECRGPLRAVAGHPWVARAHHQEAAQACSLSLGCSEHRRA